MSNTGITVGGIEIKPGSSATIDVPMASLYSHAPMSLPVQVICGKRHGPTLFVSAALHGDEINGVEIIRRLLRLPQLGRLRGTLLAIPIVNVYGFVSRSRYPGSPRPESLVPRLRPWLDGGTPGGTVYERNRHQV